MIEAINKAKAKICGIAAGSVGKVDETNPTVKAALAAGLIVDVEVERKRLAVALGGPSVEDLQARIRELEALAAKPETAAQKAAGKAKG